MEDTLVFTNVVQVTRKMDSPAVICMYSSGLVTVTIDEECVFDTYLKNADEITGITYIPNTIIYTIKESNILNIVRCQQGELEMGGYLLSQIVVSEYDRVRVMKNVMNTDCEWIILTVFSGVRTEKFLIYDIGIEKGIDIIPFDNELIDLAVIDTVSDYKGQTDTVDSQKEGDKHLISYGESNRLLDIDFEEMEYILVKQYPMNRGSEIWNKNNGLLIDYLGIVEGLSDTFTEQRYSTSVKGRNMRFPLDSFFREWPDDGKGCISSSGKYIVYLYSRLANPVIIVANVLNGDVHRIFDMPKELHSEMESTIIYYNDKKEYLMLVMAGQSSTYCIDQDESLIKELNDLYNAGLNGSKGKTAETGINSFSRIYWKTIESAAVKKI